MLLPKKEYVLPILKLSIPIFLGKFVMSLGKVIVNSMCGHFWNDYTSDVVIGSLIVGTLGVSNNMCGLITSPTNSFEEGESTIVSQNLGNGNMKRTIKAFIVTLIYVSIVSVLGYVLMRFVFINQLIELFSSPDKDAEIYKNMVKEIFVWDSLSIIALGITAAVLGLLYGYGQTRLSTILNLSRIGSRIIILLIFHSVAPDLSPTLCAGLSMGISNTVILIISITFLVIFLLRIKKKGYMGMHLSDPEPEIAELKFE
jgi:Na+-driven multidrug efflux pump